MTDKEIFEKVIEKAYQNDTEGYIAQVIDFVPLYRLQYDEHYAVIFSHEFAEAFWGKSDYLDPDIAYYIPAWQYHLSKMVLEKEPLKYLEKFLKD